jgi:hypothetical protein
VTEGRINVQGEILSKQDHARIHAIPEVTITAETIAECIIIDVPDLPTI